MENVWRVLNKIKSVFAFFKKLNRKNYRRVKSTRVDIDNIL